MPCARCKKDFPCQCMYELNSGMKIGESNSDDNLARPCWEKCDMCDDFRCNIHQGEHVADCECPGIDWWVDNDMYPYDTTVEEFKEKMA